MSHPFMTLPAEVRAVILNQLPQSLILEIRLLNRQLRKEIDEFFCFNLTLDDRRAAKELEWTLGLKMKELVVLQLIKSVYKPPVQPTWIKSLKIETECITHFNFMLLLKQVSNSSLETLIIVSDVILIPPPLDTKVLEFRNLKKLQLHNGSQRSSYNRWKSEVSANYTLLKYLNCHRLVSLNLNISYLTCPYGPLQSCYRWPLDAISFLGRCDKTLTRLYLNLFNFCAVHPCTDFLLNLFNLSTITNLKTIQIAINQSEQITGIVQELLLCQQNLETIRIQDYFTYHLSGLGVHRNLIFNNRDSLKELDIMDFGWEGSTLDGRPIPFDLGLLEECSNLIRLTISRHRQRRPRVYPYGPELINCSRLPSSLQLLDISNLLFTTQDILTFVSDQSRTDGLQTLHLASHIVEELGYGVTPRVLYKILRLSNILDVVVDNFSTPDFLRDRLILGGMSRTYNLPIQLENTDFGLKIERLTVLAPWTLK